MSQSDLRWRLRQLPNEIEPPRDLWPGIAARLPAQAPRRPHRRWLGGLSLAASLALGLGLAWQLRVPEVARPDPQAELVQREADALTREYEAALGNFDGLPMPEPLAPALATLDSSAGEIRAALDADPQARYLLGKLRRTYARRLELTQRAAGSPHA
ncbi:MAG TPA: hypothetical protein VFQ84_12740 [Arenimonas sp.]|uniref:hypothetical protein n=1 Tax=Arenimonas sp. TaxID=1872635 RepID=UPI002D80C532|nr:hypothetical protein [Arenimonas sp.]HEU0154200.1 hypothetical protein [Arenimonas sp.]